MYIQSYKELIVWQKSIDLVEKIYILANQLPKEETYGLIAQMRRAAVSIPSNIAEGQRRKDLPEFLHFLRVADASSAELETQIIISKKLYPVLNYSEVNLLLDEIQKMLTVMMQKLELKANNSKLKAINGQIMIESIVSITLVTVGLLGIFSLASRSLGLNRTVADRYAGTYLAAEGIELVKNLIDKNFIDRRPWNSGISAGDYEMDYDDMALSLSADRPLRFDPVGSFYGYDFGNPTLYKRLIKIEEPSDQEIKVVSLVTWSSRGIDYEAELEDHFFNWR